MFPCNDILNPGPNSVKYECLPMEKFIIKYLYRCWQNVYGINNSVWLRESPIQKNWWKYTLVKCITIYWYNVFSHGRLNFVTCATFIYTVLYTTLMCLSMGYLTFLYVLQRCKLFWILLQISYFLINLTKKGWQFPCLWLWNSYISKEWR